jgi:hypothetical protein
MQGREYIVDSVVAALRLRPTETYGRYRLIAIPAGARIEVQGDSTMLSGMVEACWNGQAYVLFPAELDQKAHPIAA